MTQSETRSASLATESLWGAQRIADFMGVSDDFVRKLAKQAATPIRIRGGRYYSTKTEIVTWLCPHRAGIQPQRRA